MLSASAGEIKSLLAADLDKRLALDRRSNRGGEPVPVDGERSPRGQHVGVGSAQHQRAEPAHLLVQEADGAASCVVGTERVRANELGEIPGFVHCGGTKRPHFVQHHGYAAARKLPRRLRAGEAATDDVSRLGRAHHGLKLGGVC
jgi:hypothetical protein